MRCKIAHAGPALAAKPVVALVPTSRNRLPSCRWLTLPHPWRLLQVILLSDGSVTRHLQLMTNQRVEVRLGGIARRSRAPLACLTRVCAGQQCWVLPHVANALDAAICVCWVLHGFQPVAKCVAASTPTRRHKTCCLPLAGRVPGDAQHRARARGAAACHCADPGTPGAAPGEHRLHDIVGLHPWDTAMRTRTRVFCARTVAAVLA